MTSHVDAQVQAAIAAARNKRQQQREDRAQFAERRAAGLVARKAAKLRRRCAVCDRPLSGRKGRACGAGCGQFVCRKPHRPDCGDVHAGQCPNGIAGTRGEAA
ncbi:hypothetical protein [Streptomyces fumanus]|uniref:hypothetical protein n=1 Tax=Streptomyces fumanus TaxID=67302 RepID=UPI0033D268EC